MGKISIMDKKWHKLAKKNINEQNNISGHKGYKWTKRT